MATPHKTIPYIAQFSTGLSLPVEYTHTDTSSKQYEKLITRQTEVDRSWTCYNSPIMSREYVCFLNEYEKRITTNCSKFLQAYCETNTPDRLIYCIAEVLIAVTTITSYQKCDPEYLSLNNLDKHLEKLIFSGRRLTIAEMAQWIERNDKHLELVKTYMNPIDVANVNADFYSVPDYVWSATFQNI